MQSPMYELKNNCIYTYILNKLLNFIFCGSANFINSIKYYHLTKKE